MQSPSEYLREVIARDGGAISVERFMQEALYHPRFGYYANRVRRIGAEGDFSTSATMHRALPQALAAWAAAHRAEVRHGGTWNVIELGGGSGEMAEGFMNALGWLARRGLRYHLVEVSKPLQSLQEQRLKRCGGRVRWHTDIAAAVSAANGRALIFSNEFVDAFPCVQLSRTDGQAGAWSEVMLSWPDGSPHPVESLIPWTERVSGVAESSVLEPGYQSSFPVGSRVEIHRSYQRWLQGWVPRWEAGRLLTIDYGDVLPNLYHRRTRGTLRGYVHHQRVEGEEIYQRFGQQDLTADVNFTDLQGWGTSMGLQTAGFCAQAQFLRRWLTPRQLARAKTSDRALAFLLDEAGAGGAFKVLEQVKPAMTPRAG